jgi:pyrimidine-nucleoside phosphorylase
MRFVDLIEKKKAGLALTKDEIQFWIDGYVKGDIPDYQVSALLMAIVLNGMDEREMTTLTLEMAASGSQMDLSYLESVPVDKHSTGGVGDKITRSFCPL